MTFLRSCATCSCRRWLHATASNTESRRKFRHADRTLAVPHCSWYCLCCKRQAHKRRSLCMSAEVQEDGRQVSQSSGQLGRLCRGAAGAASRLKGLFRPFSLREKRSAPAASVGLQQLHAPAESHPEYRDFSARWASNSITRAAKKGTFPCRLCTSGVGPLRECQELVTTGSRQFGLGGFGSALKVRIYDFAVYVHSQQAKASALARNSPALQKPAEHVNFCKGLRSSDDIDMSLMVRASRNLPIKLLSKEYERILRRRLQRVGGSGSQTDAALAQMLASFKEENLPDSVKQGGSVKKGTVLAFVKHGPGTLIAKADGKNLITITSPKLCQAVFDLYLGDQPVSAESRQAAGVAVMGMMGAFAYQTPEHKGLCKIGADNYQVLL